MAWAILAKPGEKYGPCKGECEHRDCAASRAEAKLVCPDCKKAIGYDTRFCTFEGKTWHDLCLDLAVEAGRV